MLSRPASNLHGVCIRALVRDGLKPLGAIFEKRLSRRDGIAQLRELDGRVPERADVVGHEHLGDDREAHARREREESRARKHAPQQLPPADALRPGRKRGKRCESDPGTG